MTIHLNAWVDDQLTFGTVEAETTDKDEVGFHIRLAPDLDPHVSGFLTREDALRFSDELRAAALGSTP